jgi:hypothetical protein
MDNRSKLLTAMSRLRSLERAWPDGYSLFAASDMLMLIRTDDQKIVGSYIIPCDGGDPEIHNDGDNMYLVF